jgi:hypothetical protein
MKRYLKITLLSLSLFVVAFGTLLFTQTGNDLLKPYLQAKLEKEVGLPVEIKHFTLRYDHTALSLIINEALHVDMKSIFQLLGLRFEGTYNIYANNFIYNTITLKEANIHGEFKGVPDDLFVNGKGSTFDAPLDYHLRLIEGEAEEITFQLKEMELSDLLPLIKQPALAKGKVDANITIPTLQKGKMNAHGIFDLTEVNFNDALIKEYYKVVLPKSLKANGMIEANLTNEEIRGSVAMQSNVADVNLNDVHFNRKSKAFHTYYLLDITDLKKLSPLLHTKMNGPLQLQGYLKKEKFLRVTGITNSLGGEIEYRLVDKRFSSFMKSVPMENLLKMLDLPAFMNAEGYGSVAYDLNAKKGNIALDMESFTLARNKVTKGLKMVMPKDPASIVFGETTLDAKIDGALTTYKLTAKSNKASILIDEGTIDTAKNSHNAEIVFAYKKYAVDGTIKGSVRDPSVRFNTKGLLPERNFLAKVEKEVRRFFKRLF